ncbi:MAG: phosphoribosylanthranilate isomerase [Acidobacteria bacterium]|nr:phosphoribosylanthranilate isomerase [Acidobacteriota bacterium]
MIHVKICGLRRAEDVAAAVAAGADALGFNFWTGTKRYIDPAEAAPIIQSVPKNILTVGVFVDETPARMLEIAALTGIGAIQLHGNESPEVLAQLGAYRKIKAIKVGAQLDVAEIESYRAAEVILLDRAVAGMTGGTGQKFDWSLAIAAKKYATILLAGGLTPANVAEAIRQVQPWGVDVASGVETAPGVKDATLIREFIRNARAA